MDTVKSGCPASTKLSLFPAEQLLAVLPSPETATTHAPTYTVSIAPVTSLPMLSLALLPAVIELNESVPNSVSPVSIVEFDDR